VLSPRYGIFSTNSEALFNNYLEKKKKKKKKKKRKRKRKKEREEKKRKY
jgi:hypothetical protein